MTELLPYLLSVEARNDRLAAVARDPVRFAHRYADPLDQEIAALIAAVYASGRVTLFGAVLERLFAAFDTRGGPAAFVTGYRADRDRAVLACAAYRFYKPSDLALLVQGLQQTLAERPSLSTFFTEPNVAEGLHAMVAALRVAAWSHVDPADPPRGFRHLLTSPRDGSACKRLNLFLRWMVRPADGVDLGLWTSLTPADLLIPLDVHVLRISRFLGLTRRTDASWRTAVEVTAGLRRLDPADPVRFDFALSHLGISGACRGARYPDPCRLCPLDPVCTAEEGRAEAP